MADFMWNYETECSLWKGRRIRGNLKTSPKDFIVTEIDLSGNLAILDLSTPIPKLPSLSPSISVPTSKQRQTTSLEENESDLSTPDSTLPHDLDQHVSTPDSTLPHDLDLSIPDSTLSQDLTLLLNPEDLSSVCRLNTQWETSVQLGTEDVTQSVNLGCHGDKISRAAVHLAVRREFPSLKTSTRKTKEGDSEIIVHPDSAYSSLARVLGPEESKKILMFVNLAERNSTSTYLLPPDDSKVHRTEVHRTIDQLFGHLVETKSFTEPRPPPHKKRKIEKGKEKVDAPIVKGPKICVRFRSKFYSRIKKKNTLIGDDHRRQKEWYTKFVLRKENTETLDAIHQLSGMLSCHPSQFSFAGMKDRRAITHQWMTVKNVSAERLSSLSHPLLQCGNYEYVSNPLRLGDLKGNHFNLRLTGVTLEEEEEDSVGRTGKTMEDAIRGCLSSLECNGFINYYGPQRFGVSREETTINSPSVGLAMLQQDPIKAVNLILLPNDSDKTNGSVLYEAKSYYAGTGDIEGTLSRMPDNRTREIMVLKALKRHGKTEYGCRRALMNIPYQMRLLYVHSFTSLIWNHLASFRMQQYGNHPVEGDLVITDEGNSMSDRVRSLTAVDIQSSTYSLCDVVLPLPGNSVALPVNDVKKRFFELLSTHGMSLPSFKQLRQFGLSVPGGYRKLVAQPQIHSWKLDRGAQMDKPVTFQACDNDSASEINSCMKSSEVLVGKEVDSLEISFSLPSSCYATTMLRELKKE